jgi:hypothetical protein
VSEIEVVEPPARVKLALVSRKYVSSSSLTTMRTRAETGPEVGLCTVTVTVWPDDPVEVAWSSEESASAGVRTRRDTARQNAFSWFDMVVSFQDKKSGFRERQGRRGDAA